MVSWIEKSELRD